MDPTLALGEWLQRAVDALDLTREALEAAPREWRLALAQVLEQLGYYRPRIGLAGSRSLLERSLALLSPVDPSDIRTDAQRDYGVTLSMTGDFEHGIKFLRAALRPKRLKREREAQPRTMHRGQACAA